MKRKKIEMHKLVNRNSAYPVSVQADVFQWMLKTGWSFRDRHGVFELLYGLSSHDAQYHNWQYGIKFPEWSISAFLKAAFVRAIVADDVSSNVVAWRKKECIGLDQCRMLNLPEQTLWHLDLRDLRNYSKKPLTTQLNKHHRRAVETNYVLLSPNETGWMASVHYGYDHSVWRHDLAQERMGFADAVMAATERMEELTATPPANAADVVP